MRLNPFIYLSETDILFYSLILLGAVVPAYWALLIGFTVGTVQFGGSNLLLYLLYAIVFVSIPALTYWHYRGSTQRVLKDSQMKPFQESTSPEYFRDIQGFYANLPHTCKEPLLGYNRDSDASACTISLGKNMCIQMSRGLLVSDDSDVFKAVFLHELGHIENKDVRKTSIAISVMSTMKLVLPVILAVFVFYDIYLNTGILYYGLRSGHDANYVFSIMQFGPFYFWIGVTAAFFVVIGLIIYALRNQIVRLREFYADAKVVEWLKSPTVLEKTLEKFKGSTSRLEFLKKFHPSTQERINIAKNNSRLFLPNLWILFAVGLLYGFLSAEVASLPIVFFYQRILSEGFAAYYVFDILTAIFFFGISMLAVGSEFHKLIQREWLSKKTRFSSTAALNILKVTGAFSLGFIFSYLIANIETVGGYFDQLSTWASNMLATLTTTWITQAIHLLVVLIFLWVFGAMLVKRSFSKKAARRNFLIASVLATFFYFITNPSLAQMIFNSDVLWIVTILVFLLATFFVIKANDQRLHCPYCYEKIQPSSRHTCTKCEKPLYSWAVYSF